MTISTMRSTRFWSDFKAMIALTFIVSFPALSIAGPGGSVYLINLSGSDWKRTDCAHYGMNDWKFPDYLKNGDTSLVYVEFWYSSSPDHSAKVTYELVGTGGKSFQILAKDYPRQIELVYSNLEFDGQPKGMRKNLGWRHDGDTNVIIIGNNGKYTGTDLDGSNWMKNNMEFLGKRTLKEISIPGSHDSGMNKLNGHTAFGKSCNVLTQTLTIGDQLKQGIRYLDIRPVIGNGGDFLSGHYTYAGSLPGWQGGNGQSISSIIDDLNGFTKDHNELIIIKLSHSLNTDIGSRDYRKFNQQEWETLFQKLDKLNYLYGNNNSDVKLDQIKLSQYTNGGSKASVLFIVDDPDSKVELGSRMGKGYFLPRNLDIYDDYSNTNSWSNMINDQIKKMKQYSSGKYFLLSWTLTQSGPQALFCDPSVRDLADKANMNLGHFLYEDVSATSFPNIILVDNVNDRDVVSMAMAINAKINFKTG